MGINGLSTRPVVKHEVRLSLKMKLDNKTPKNVEGIKKVHKKRGRPKKVYDLAPLHAHEETLSDQATAIAKEAGIVRQGELIDKKGIKEAAETDLEFFIRLVAPNRVLGHVHIELIRWWTREDCKSHQLCLLPRDHQKSALIAFRVAWELTRNPSLRVLYISATSNLAIKQLYFIKTILTSDIYRYYWPEMVNEREADREKWTETEISVDHPQRKKDMIRDPSIFTAGLTTVITGMHCDIAVLDDVVVNDNARTQEGRKKVRDQVSYLASIGGTEAVVWAVGTRYHPKDLYSDLRDIVVEIHNELGYVEESYHLYETFEKKVEDRGDGTGNFLWPRAQAKDGKWYGFDRKILAQKKAQYESIIDFKAQYYNDPNDASEATITTDFFQYYDRNRLQVRNGNWHFGDRRLNVFAAIDFAFSTSEKADYTAIVVVGMDGMNNYYILDIHRFKTNLISDYFDAILRLHQKWGFRKLRAEVTVAQEMIVNDLRDNYIRRYGLALSVDKHRPDRREGNKEERIQAALETKYRNYQMWHYRGGNCELLEEELIMQRPAHDDIKDALAACVGICVSPTGASSVFTGSGSIKTINTPSNQNKQLFHSRFGGFTG